VSEIATKNQECFTETFCASALAYDLKKVSPWPKFTKNLAAKRKGKNSSWTRL